MNTDKNDNFFQLIISPSAFLLYIGFFVYLSALSGGLVWDDYSIFQNIETIKNQGFSKHNQPINKGQ